MTTETTDPHALARRSEAGMSLLELLIASVLLLFILLGIIPLYAGSAVNNAIGADATQLSNHAKTRAESLLQMPFNAPDLTLDDGELARTTDEFWNNDDPNHITGDHFVNAPVSDSLPKYTRTTVIRQYAITDAEDGVLDHPLAGGSAPGLIQIKEIQVTVRSRDYGPIPGRPLVVRVYKAF